MITLSNNAQSSFPLFIEVVPLDQKEAGSDDDGHIPFTASLAQTISNTTRTFAARQQSTGIVTGVIVDFQDE